MSRDDRVVPYDPEGRRWEGAEFLTSVDVTPRGERRKSRSMRTQRGVPYHESFEVEDEPSEVAQPSLEVHQETVATLMTLVTGMHGMMRHLMHRVNALEKERRKDAEWIALYRELKRDHDAVR